MRELLTMLDLILYLKIKRNEKLIWITSKKIGEELGIDWTKFDIEQFKMGMDVELEHGLRDMSTNVTDDNPIMTGKIALAHLNEFPDYYTRLEKLEKEGEDYWQNK